MKPSFEALVLLCCCMLVSAVYAADSSLSQKCTGDLQKVMECLPYASAKASIPTKACCDSTSDIKDSDPVCLCFLIQQIHNGSVPALKELGIREDRLLQLPSVCKLENASVSECPRLLNLPPNSSDAAIFNHGSGTTVSTPSSSPVPSTTGGPSSGAVWLEPLPILVQLMVFVSTTIFLHASFSADHGLSLV